MKSLLAAVLVLLVGPTRAHAQFVGLAWDDCTAAGTTNKSFACDTNSGEPFVLWQSVSPPEGVEDYVGFVSTLKLLAWASVLPDWWSIGTCRAPNTIQIQQGSGESSCRDLTESLHWLAYDYDLGHGGPNRARLRVFGGLAPEAAVPLVAYDEAVLCKVVIHRSRAVAAGETAACGGCTVPMCILFESVLLEARDPRSSRMISSGALNIASWNNSGGIAPCFRVPTHTRSWGALKSLYR